MVRWAARTAGVRLRPPEHVPLDDPEPIVRWMQGVLRHGGVPHMWTYTSAGVRLAQAACATGVDLTGAELAVLGEPITARASRRSGARASAPSPLRHQRGGADRLRLPRPGIGR